MTEASLRDIALKESASSSRLPAVILFSHGSVLCGAGIALDEHAERIRRSTKYVEVAVGYLNYSEPTFAEAVQRCYDAGARRILVAPFFLVPGYFVTTALPKQIATAQADFPDVEFLITPPLGFDELLADALIESARNPLPASSWRDDLTNAARYCRANSQCPLFGTPRCPRVPGMNPVPPGTE